jgi:hypothetical protein
MECRKYLMRRILPDRVKNINIQLCNFKSSFERRYSQEEFLRELSIKGAPRNFEGRVPL